MGKENKAVLCSKCGETAQELVTLRDGNKSWRHSIWCPHCGHEEVYSLAGSRFKKLNFYSIEYRDRIVWKHNEYDLDIKFNKKTKEFHIINYYSSFVFTIDHIHAIEQQLREFEDEKGK